MTDFSPVNERRLCLVPARGGSRRLPRKNIAPLCGKPLLAYTIEAARESGLFPRVLVSTEDEEIMRIAEACGAEVFYRPIELASDTATTVDVCLYTLSRLAQTGEQFDVLAVPLPSPIRMIARSPEVKGTTLNIARCSRGSNPALKLVVSLFERRSPSTA